MKKTFTQFLKEMPHIPVEIVIDLELEFYNGKKIEMIKKAITQWLYENTNRVNEFKDKESELAKILISHIGEYNYDDLIEDESLPLHHTEHDSEVNTINDLLHSIDIIIKNISDEVIKRFDTLFSLQSIYQRHTKKDISLGSIAQVKEFIKKIDSDPKTKLFIINFFGEKCWQDIETLMKSYS
jgi:hypothetical protein